jgi:hypothetical protein
MGPLSFSVYPLDRDVNPILLGAAAVERMPGPRGA